MKLTIKKYYFLLPFIYLFISCAQFVPPTGGIKDIIPPKLVSSVPENATLNFKDQSFLLTFDEIIETSTLRQELIITPEPDGVYELKAKAYSVELKFSKPFKDSTTYTINFRNGIKDATEKNPATNLKLVFSTTDKIDSLSIRGNVTKLWTGTVAEEVLVALYDLNSTDTLPLLKRKPNYFTRTDTSGNYSFENLKNAKYQIISFDDKNLNLLFDQSSEEFGYIKDTINLISNISNQDIKIYPQDRTPIKVKRTLARQNNYSISFNKSYKSIEVSFPNNDSLTYQKRDSEILFYKYPIISDTTLTKIIVVDSVDNKLELEQKIYFQESRTDTPEKPSVISIKSKIQPNDKLIKPINYQFDFEYPITSLDTSKIKILGDTLINESYQYHWLDKSQTSLCITTEPTAQREIQITFLKGSLTNYRSDTNKTYQLINILYPQDQFGIISGTTTNDSTHKIVQLIDYRTLQIVDYQLTIDKFNFQKVIPSSYYLRVIYDNNKNGYWDTSDFELNIEPEKIKIYPELIKLKSNFEINNLTIP